MEPQEYADKISYFDLEKFNIICNLIKELRIIHIIINYVSDVNNFFSKHVSLIVNGV